MGAFGVSTLCFGGMCAFKRSGTGFPTKSAADQKASRALKLVCANPPVSAKPRVRNRREKAEEYAGKKALKSNMQHLAKALAIILPNFWNRLFFFTNVV